MIKCIETSAGIIFTNHIVVMALVYIPQMGDT